MVITSVKKLSIWLGAYSGLERLPFVLRLHKLKCIQLVVEGGETQACELGSVLLTQSLLHMGKY